MWLIDSYFLSQSVRAPNKYLVLACLPAHSIKLLLFIPCLPYTVIHLNADTLSRYARGGSLLKYS